MGVTMIREIRPDEYPLLDDFLYEAIYIPDGVESPPRSITAQDELQVYVRDFGRWPDDHGLVAECDGKVVGAVWVRVMDDYGHVDDQTPSLAISCIQSTGAGASARSCYNGCWTCSGKKGIDRCPSPSRRRIMPIGCTGKPDSR